VDFPALPARHGFHRLHRFVRPLHHRAGFREKGAPGFGEPDGFRAVIEKRHAKFIFDVANLPA